MLLWPRSKKTHWEPWRLARNLLLPLLCCLHGVLLALLLLLLLLLRVIEGTKAPLLLLHGPLRCRTPLLLHGGHLTPWRHQACQAKLGWVEAWIGPSSETGLLCLLLLLLTWRCRQRPAMSLTRCLPGHLLLLVLHGGTRPATWACTGRRLQHHAIAGRAPGRSRPWQLAWQQPRWSL